LAGVDLSEKFIETARRERLLEGVELFAADFTTADFLNRFGAKFDIATMHAITTIIDNPTTERLMKATGSLLRSGGMLIDYDCFQHQHKQMVIDLGGHKLYYNNKDWMRGVLENSGFADVAFTRFDIPVDLGGDENKDITRTETLASGRRLMFRGSICQCWHILTARKV